MGKSMNEIEVLQKISSNLTDRKGAAALSNYRVLCNNIAFLNSAFVDAVNSIKNVHQALRESLKNDDALSPNYRSGASLSAFVPIVIRLQLNGFTVFDKLAHCTQADVRSAAQRPDLSILSRGFESYNTLVTATRQYVDSIVSDSYQLYLLNPKSFNYHVLVSLNSFSKFATKSLMSALFNTEVEAALNEFGALKYKDWSKSHITECAHPTFAQKVDFLIASLGATTIPTLSDNLKDLFKFSSEFTHIGYTSTFFTSSSGAEVIFGDEDGPYLPSTENYSELKYEILETCCKLFAAIYIPSLIACLEKVMENKYGKQFIEEVRASADALKTALASRNAKYYFFIRAGLVKSPEVIRLPCLCGTTREWVHPHSTAELYCSSCGSAFHLLEVDTDGSYIMTSNGPAKIIGSSGPDFVDLPQNEQVKIIAKFPKKLKEGNP